MCYDAGTKRHGLGLARPVFVALAVVLLFVAYIAVFQDRLIYFPEN